MNKVNSSIFLLLVFYFIAGLPFAMAKASEATAALLQEYQQNAEAAFSAEAGKTLWSKVTNKRSCTSCHLSSIRQNGKHLKTGKIIQPMAPSVNPERLTDRKKIKKWLLRNCKWTFGRECTNQEKGHLLLWLSQQ